ncbi:MAG TPA: alpha/beta hydrolase, partial [Methylocella sp.]|nr:alpha/beta hydrolase [Methylocella sp.]
DADTTDSLCKQLDEHYTVVAYDRRGLSRSTLDCPPQNLTITTHSDDAQRLLVELTDQPALVVGSSIGALIGPDLVARHPEQVRLLVAHEPPAWELLPDAERDHAEKVQEDAEETFRREGADAAFKKFVALAAVNYEDREPDVVLAPPTAERTANLSFFFTYDSPAVRRYRIDIAALSALSTRILAACGTSAPQSAPYRVATALAAKLVRRLSSFRAVTPVGFCVRRASLQHCAKFFAELAKNRSGRNLGRHGPAEQYKEFVATFIVLAVSCSRGNLVMPLGRGTWRNQNGSRLEITKNRIAGFRPARIEKIQDQASISRWSRRVVPPAYVLRHESPSARQDKSSQTYVGKDSRERPAQSRHLHRPIPIAPKNSAILILPRGHLSLA